MDVFWPKVTLIGFYCTPYTFIVARQVVIVRSTSVCINRQILISSSASAAGRWWQQNTVCGPVVGLPGCILGLVIIRSEIRVRIMCTRVLLQNTDWCLAIHACSLTEWCLGRRVGTWGRGVLADSLNSNSQ